ncbi:MAG: dihydrodipicolinate synthase family protein [Gaiellaceae bacterium]
MSLSPGVHSVIVTPFAADESLDEAALRSVVDYYVGSGLTGILVLGVLGEADRLADAERERVQRNAIEHVQGRVQVTVGVSHAATVVAAERARSAERMGATAVMVAPPGGSAAGPALRDHFRRVADGLSIPLVVQDLPSVSGVQLPVDFLVDLADVLPPGSAIKLEDPPTPAKIERVGEAAPSLGIFGGLGGAALLQELEAGSDGTMTGFALPAILVEIVEAHASGEAERARRRFEATLPLLVFEAQPVVGLGVRKEILRRRGAISDATVRQVAPSLDARTLEALDSLLDPLLQIEAGA